MKTIGILQPGYLPWLGFFEQLYRSDIFVIYDDVQYDKHSWRNRNRIKTPTGPIWLTVPVLTRGKSGQLVSETLIDNRSHWGEKHLKALQANYARAPFFKEYYPVLGSVLSTPQERLADLDAALIQKIAGLLNLKTEIIRSSQLNIQGDKINRLISLCRHFGAGVFYEGKAGEDYIEPREFGKNGIRVEFQNYQHPVYRQLHGEFVSHLSIADLLFNHGPESLKILIGEAAVSNP
jgi:hypothetical protein